MTKQKMIEFLKAERDREHQTALGARAPENADSFELAAQKFHAIICYLEGRANV
jgi:hypothetical protein